MTTQIPANIQTTTIQLPNITIAGKLWGEEDGEKAIALHGWYDNANTFDWLGPRLDNMQIFAMDLAGHGFSGHRRNLEVQRGDGDMADVLGVADALGWDKFTLIGHSMGAEIAGAMTAMFPERVQRLICLDGFVGATTSSRTLRHFRRATLATMKQPTTPRVYASLDDMTERLSEVMKITIEEAVVLMERGVKKVEGGFTWRSDSRTKDTGPLEMNSRQFEALLDAIKAPSLIIRAEGSARFEYTFKLLTEKPCPDNVELTFLPGGHHLHLSKYVDGVADTIKKFCERTPAFTCEYEVD